MIRYFICKCGKKVKKITNNHKYCKVCGLINKRNTTKRWFKNNPKAKTLNIRKCREWRQQNKEKKVAEDKARQITMPVGQICEKCKKELAKDKHHKDYNKPLEVIFVCKKCHYKLNRGEK